MKIINILRLVFVDYSIFYTCTPCRTFDVVVVKMYKLNPQLPHRVKQTLFHFILAIDTET